MTDHNPNKINLESREKFTPDESDPRLDVSAEGDVLTGNETFLAEQAGATEIETVEGGPAVPNPFADMVGEAPMEAELRELAAHNSGVQLTETYQIHTGTPAGCSLATPTGSQGPEDLLACIGMSVRVTRTLEAEGVPTSEVPDTGQEGTRTHTIITQQEAQGVIFGALNDPSRPDSSRLPGTMGEDDLYEINTDFAADMLKDGGEETVAQLMETYHPTSDSPIDVPAIDLDFNQFDLDESGFGPETRTGPEKEPGKPAIMTEDTNSNSRADISKAGAAEAGEGPSSPRPGPQKGAAEIEISGIGLF